jgi:AbrB family looped-hinge helix DNA binding protein
MFKFNVTFIGYVMNDETMKPPVVQGAWSTRVTSGGRVVLPAEARVALGLRDGTPVRVFLQDGRLTIVPFAEIIRDIQARWRRYIPGDRSLADELIADRRAEAERE